MATPSPACSLGGGMANVSWSGVLAASSGNVQATSLTMIVPPDGAGHTFTPLRVTVTKSSAQSCTIVRRYAEGAGSTEVLTYGDDGSIHWSLSASSASALRLPARVVTAVNVTWVAPAVPTWWAPIESGRCGTVGLTEIDGFDQKPSISVRSMVLSARVKNRRSQSDR
jgi:hypothetical protein